jgi:hypothetical protein
MKNLLNGCALVALLVGVAGPALAQDQGQAAAVSDAVVLSAAEQTFFASIGRHVTDSASAYDSYVRHAEAIDPRFANANAVQVALRAGADYQPDQLEEGVVAYAALLALRDQAFVDGVRAQADAGFADRLIASPGAVLQVPGARDAEVDVIGVLRAHGAALQTTGKAITQAAYDVQHQDWSKGPVANPVEVLAGIKASALHARLADVPTEKALLVSLNGAPRNPADASAAPSGPVVRGLALAALAVLGRTGEQDDTRIEVLMEDRAMADCLKLARMNLNQCLAAAGPHYDDVFCAGEHAVGETARCVASATDTGGVNVRAERDAYGRPGRRPG